MLAEGDLPLDIAFIDDVGRSGLTGLIPGLEEAADLVEEPLRPAIGAATGSKSGEAPVKEEVTDEPGSGSCQPEAGAADKGGKAKRRQAAKLAGALASLDATRGQASCW